MRLAISPHPADYPLIPRSREAASRRIKARVHLGRSWFETALTRLLTMRIYQQKTQREDQMAEVVVLYKTPKDAAAFDKHYAETHIPLAKKLPGLKKYAVSKGPVSSPAGPSGIHLVAVLTFDSVADIQAAFGSPEGKATGADVPKFASGGADILIFDTKEV
jgi:uncharacterized protein (TIGR02118 family)